MDPHDTIVAISSPPGAAARGIVRLSGPGAVQLAQSVFTGGEATIRELTGNRCVRGTVDLGPGRLPAMAWAFRGPRSYTRQDIVELHILGAPAVLGLLVEQLVQAGARPAEPGEFTARAFLAGAMDLSQVHGVAAMIAARSDRQLAAARRLLDGALRVAAECAREELADLLSLIEGAMDFADEPIEFITPAQLRDRLSRAWDSLTRAIDTGLRVERWGRLPHVVLTGRPNAGKSTLLNRLSGQERAIAAPIAGTTRDVLSAPLRFDGSECLLIDAAGISTAADELDQMAQCAAARAVEEADLVLHLVDVREASPGSQSGISAYGAPWVAVLTKVDLVEPKRAASVQVEIEQRTGVEVYLASAVTGAGCDALVESISAALRERSSDGAADSMALIGAHHEALVAAREALGRAIEIAGASMDSLENADLVAMELHAAATELGRLVGKDLPDDLLGRIFARFCVGK